MGVPKKHHTKSKVGRRRSHQALKPVRPIICPVCKAPTLSHRICANCGAYGAKLQPPRQEASEELEEI